MPIRPHCTQPANLSLITDRHHRARRASLWRAKPRARRGARPISPAARRCDRRCALRPPHPNRPRPARPARANCLRRSECASRCLPALRFGHGKLLGFTNDRSIRTPSLSLVVGQAAAVLLAVRAQPADELLLRPGARLRRDVAARGVMDAIAAEKLRALRAAAVRRRADHTVLAARGASPARRRGRAWFARNGCGRLAPRMEVG